MTKEGKTAVVPKLRFPEFVETSDWEISSLGEAFSRITNGKANAQDHEEGGVYPLFDRSDTIKSSHSFLFDAEVIVLPGEGASFNPRHFQGKFNLHQRAYALMNCQGHSRFFYYALDQAKERLAHKAVKSTVLSLRLPIIEQFEVSVPDLDEQQKIADCLTSLDELIAAQGRKVEALKTYKRGLMQQLFPREGETLPRLRFPEFRDAPEWADKRLSEVIDLVSGLHLSPDEYSAAGDVPYYTGPSDFSDDVQCATKWTKVSANVAKEHDTLITVKGSGVGEVWYLEMPSVAMGRQLMAVRAHQDCSSRFIFQVLLTKRSRFEDLAAGNLIPGLARGDILNLVAPIPEKDEQRRIAGCLSSLDDQIAVESKQLDALRRHKKGLMQQLFPVLEENKA